METNIILAGVGGQGIVSIAYVIDMAALEHGLSFKQAEVHGMSQRGGAVQSHLRISSQPIHSDLIPRGRCDLILSVEPLESLRYVEFLAPTGTVVSATEPFVNIPNYADIDRVLDTISALPNHVVIPAERLARAVGSARAANMVILGAASPYLGLPEALLEKGIIDAFRAKGDRIQQMNLAAFRAGKAAGAAYRACLAAGIPSRNARVLVGRVDGGTLHDQAIAPWKQVFDSSVGPTVHELLASGTQGRLPGSPDLPVALLGATGSSRDAVAALLFQSAKA
jgi:indolepyruvate ferredoxin oxidoreductase beta subunit